MIKAKAALKTLQRTQERLERLGDDEIVGLAVICPPEGDSIEILLEGSAPNLKAFYEYMIGRIGDAAKALDANPYGGPYIGTRQR